MASTRELFVNSVRLVEYDGRTNIPTALLYEGSNWKIGYEAIESAASPDQLIEDFKVELGNTDPEATTQLRKFETAGGAKRTAAGLAKDFVEKVLAHVNVWTERQGLKRPSRVLIAEPIAMGSSQTVTDSWLSNYRSSLRRALKAKFDELDFLPEPFAVFQYYRYGVRHALLAQQKRHVALVLDFGGGTFDVSVIETNAQGDISQSGRNQRPLAATSVPIGGYAINRAIAEVLLFESLGARVQKADVRKALGKYNELKNAGPQELEALKDDFKNFIRNFRRCLTSVERAKIALCRSIANWSLSADLSKATSYRINIPRNPCSEGGEWAEIALPAARFRTLFEDLIWKQHLKSAISGAIGRAEKELDGKPISIILLSGGSSNIRWLRPLMERDLSADLQEAEIIELSENFQEIVAKGLAIECARRFYTEGQGDFRAVTYNRLCLALKSNSGELELKRYKPLSSELPSAQGDEGVLLPSSSVLSGLMGIPLRWKVRLNDPPTRHLDYFFMRGSFDPEDISNLQNIDHRVTTPKNTKFGSAIEVELVVREDGTTEPTFIYGSATRVDGRPFYIDMTFGADQVAGETYLGLDFGTSNSSVSFVQNDEIRAYSARAADKTWRELSDLVSTLPYPIASPLALFISETSKERMDILGRETVEAAICLAAYVAYAEHCSTKGRGASRLFAGMAHRSAGPVWKLLQESLRQLGPSSYFSASYKQMLREAHYKEIDFAISQIAQSKHGKLAIGLDYPRLLTLICNISNQVFTKFQFGYFEQVLQKPFQNNFFGVFRVARGAGRPFIDMMAYEGRFSFSSEQVFLCDAENGKALRLTPLMFWGTSPGQLAQEENELYLFDSLKPRENAVAFKAVQMREELLASDQTELSVLYDAISNLHAEDAKSDLVQDLKLDWRVRSSI